MGPGAVSDRSSSSPGSTPSRPGLSTASKWHVGASDTTKGHDWATLTIAESPKFIHTHTYDNTKQTHACTYNTYAYPHTQTNADTDKHTHTHTHAHTRTHTHTRTAYNKNPDNNTRTHTHLGLFRVPPPQGRLVPDGRVEGLPQGCETGGPPHGCCPAPHPSHAPPPRGAQAHQTRSAHTRAGHRGGYGDAGTCCPAV